MVIEKALLGEIIPAIRKLGAENRPELKYPEGAIGLTSLLYCPLKAEYRAKYPELEQEALEIDEGFLWEWQVHTALSQKYGKKAIAREVEITTEVGKKKVTGHIDIVIEGKKAILALELKCMKFVSLTPEGVRLVEEGQDVVFGKAILPEHYVLQGKIQKLLLEANYSKPVHLFILVKSMTRIKGKFKKVIVVHPIREAAKPEELSKLISDFESVKEPRYPWECHLCVYAQVCSHREKFLKSSKQQGEKISEETKRIIEEYIEIIEKKKTLEDCLKTVLQGEVEVEVAGRKRRIGWRERPVHRWNVETIVDYLGEKALPFLQVNGRKAGQLEEALLEAGVPLEEVRETEIKREFKGL